MVSASFCLTLAMIAGLGWGGVRYLLNGIDLVFVSGCFVSETMSEVHIKDIQTDIFWRGVAPARELVIGQKC